MTELKVLLVDDDPVVTLYYAAFFRSCLIGVWEAHSEEEALRCLSENRFDAVFVDLDLGSGKSFLFLEELVDSFKDSLIFVLSSDSDPQVVSQCLNKGAAHFFSKGARPLDFVSKLKELKSIHSFAQETCRSKDVNCN